MHRCHLALAVSAGAALWFAIADRAWAQPLDVEIARLLDNDCAALVPPGGSGSPVGPNLDQVCSTNSPSAVSSSGGGGASPQGSDTTIESQRALDRAEEEREGGDANAVQLGLAGLSLWTTADFTREDREVTTFEDGYESDNWTSTTGIDYRFADFLFAGLAFDYENIDADFAGGGGFDTDSYGGILYGSLTPFKDLFVDAAVGYAAKDYEVDRVANFTEFEAGFPSAVLSGIASSDTEGEEFNARGVAGYDFAFGSVSISPRAGASFVHTEIDGYREKGNSGLELIFGDRTRQSLQSELGVNASLSASAGFGVVVPEADFEYIHEFQDDQQHISASFVEDLRSSRAVFAFENQRPDRDFFRAAFGAMVVLPRGIQIFARYHTLLGHRYFDSQGVSAGVRFELGGPSVE